MWKSVFEHLTEGVYIVDPDSHKIEYMNAQAKRMFRIPLDEDYVGKICYELIAGEDKPCEHCRMNGESCLECVNEKAYDCSSCKQTLEDGSNERKVFLRDNQRFFNMHGVDLNVSGKVVHVEYITEITEQMNVTRTVHDNNLIVHKAVEQSNLVYWEYDMLTHTCYRSERFVQALGGDYVVKMIPEELERQDFIIDEYAEKFRNLYARLLDGEDEVEDIIKVRYLNGEKWVRVHLSAVYNEEGRRVKACGILENTDTLKELEEAFYLTSLDNRFVFFSYDLRTNRLHIFPTDDSNSEMTPKAGNRLLPADFEQELAHYSEEYANELLKAVEQAKAGQVRQVLNVSRFDSELNEDRDVVIRMKTVFDSNQVPVRIYGSGKDITEQKRQQQKFTRQLAFMENNKRHSVVSFEISFENGIITNYSTRNRKLKAVDDKETLNAWIKKISANINGDDYARKLKRTFDINKLTKLYEDGKHKESVVAPFWNSENDLVWLDFEMSMLRDPNVGHILGYMVVKDVTGTTLENSVSNTVMGLDYEMVMVFDQDKGKIEWVYSFNSGNADWAKLKELSYTENLEAVISKAPKSEGKRIHDTFDIDVIKEHLNNEKAYQVSVHAVGKRPDCYKKFSFSYLDDFPGKILMGIQDVSAIMKEEHEKQRLLREALEKAKVAEKERMDFLSRMSHDLRTPLNGILGMTEIALDETTDHSIEEYLQKIQSSGNWLLSLVNDILDIAQIEKNKFMLRGEKYAVKDLLADLSIVIKEQCKQNRLSYICECQEIENDWYKVDKLRFGQLFMNLLGNAVKYTKEGGLVCFTAHVLEEDETTKTVEFHVRDTGIGMSKQFQKRAFEAFSQANTSTIAERQGSGLGLSIVKQIVDLCHGEISIDSELGKGTDITIILKLTKAKPIKKAVEKESEEENSKSTARVLVVEDQPLNAKILIKSLNKRGIHVDLAENGKLGLETYLSSKPHYYNLILMDVRMPVMDGIEATRRIRSHVEREDVDIPIVATTANAFVEDKEACFAAGMNGHVAKPINFRELYSCIDIYLEPQNSDGKAEE